MKFVRLAVWVVAGPVLSHPTATRAQSKGSLVHSGRKRSSFQLANASFAPDPNLKLRLQR